MCRTSRAGVVLVSDGADTSSPVAAEHSTEPAAAWPVFAIGVGATAGVRDREVLSIAAGDQRLNDASVDLHVSSTSSGFGREPFQLRVLSDGRLLETRRVVPSADGSPSKMDNSAFILPGSQTSSESRNEINRPLAKFNPVFLAAATPLFFCRTYSIPRP